ncbi:MAG: hypothetical protein Q7R95_09950 [bacterium]|nr:hypothetical protein [bacterium]
MLNRIYPYFTRYKISPAIIIVLFVLITTIALWLPFLLRLPNWFGLKIENSNFLYVYKHYDGPLYIVPAKTLYQPNLIDALHIDIKFPAKYFAAHLPLYPAFILLFSPIFGYLKSMVGVNLLATVLLALFFYYFIKKFKFTQHSLILTLVFLMLPRFLIVRSVGAPESLFLLFILISIFFFEKKNYLMAGLLGGLATMTKTPGILLFGAYGLTIIEEWFRLKKITFNWKWLFLGFIPLGLLTVFVIYGIQYKDFFAYFHSGDNLHLVAPFAVFNFQKNWVGTPWLEDILFYFFIYVFALINLKDIKQRSILYFGLVFFIATTFVQHRDIARYSLPLWPLACIAFEKFFTSKKFLIILIILLPAIYMYGWNFMLSNVMPIGEWQPFL